MVIRGKFSRRRWVAMLGGLAFGLVAVGPQAAFAKDEKINISFAYFASEQLYPGEVMQIWKQKLEQKTNGQVNVELYPDGTLLGRDNMFDGVAKGVVDVGMSALADPGRFPLMNGLGLPLGLKSGSVATKVAYGTVAAMHPKELDNFKVLMVMATGPGYLQTRSPMTSLADLRGREIRGTGGGVNTLKALGANPVGMPITEVTQALQTGVIEGYMTSIEVLKDFKLAGLVKHVTTHPFNILVVAALMNKSKWDSLPQNVKDAIDSLSEEVSLDAGNNFDKRAQDSIDWSVKNHGVEIHELSAEEGAKWDEKTAPLVEEWVGATEKAGLPAKEFLAKIRELQAQYSK